MCSPVVGIIFFQIDRNFTSFNVYFLFLATFLGTTIVAYFLNDWADIEADRLVKKSNLASLLPTQARWFIIILLSLFCLFPWYFLIDLPNGKISIGLWLFEISALFIYSFPPFRLKTRHFWGILCDTLYGSVLPIAIALWLFSSQPIHVNFTVIFGFVLLFFKGFRNITIHQIEDRKADKISQIKTFVYVFGTTRSVKWLNSILIPLEITANIVFWNVLVAKSEPVFATVFWFFLFWTALVFGLNFIFTYPRLRNYYNRFWYFLNDFYESWLPFSAFLIYLIHDSYSYFWILAWGLLFHKHVSKLSKEVFCVLKDIYTIARIVILKLPPMILRLDRNR